MAKLKAKEDYVLVRCIVDRAWIEIGEILRDAEVSIPHDIAKIMVKRKQVEKVG